jgi:hypothetical protein
MADEHTHKRRAPRRPDDEARVSLAPLDFEEALKDLLQVKPPQDGGTRKPAAPKGRQRQQKDLPAIE